MGGKFVKKRLKTIITILLASALTLGLSGCIENIPETTIDNNKVKTKMTEHIKDKYNTDIKVDSLVVDGGTSTSRSYTTLVNINDFGVVMHGKYDDEGNYMETTDNLINCIVNKEVKGKVKYILDSLKLTADYEVYSDITTYGDCNFGKIPTFEEIKENEGIDKSTSNINILAILYGDAAEDKDILKDKIDSLKGIIDDKIKTSVTIYLVSDTHSEKVRKFTSENDINSTISLFKDKTKENTEKLAVCDEYIKFDSSNAESFDFKNIDRYIFEISVKDEEKK